MTYQLQSTTITLEAALRDLKSQNDKVRAMAAHALGDVVAPDDRSRATNALIDALGDGRPEVRSEAALSLGDLDSEAAVAPLVRTMDDTAPAVRQAAAIALGRLGFASGFDPMARALQKGPPDLRFQAATSLAEIDPDRAAEPLLQALDDSDGEVVAAAALGLGSIGEKRALKPLAQLLETWSNPRTRFDIAYALSELGDPRCIDVLVDFVDHKDLAWDAIEALERTGAARAAEPLAKLLNRLLLSPAIKLRAAATLLKLTGAAEASIAGGADAAKARAVLTAGLSARKLEHRGLAVQLLGNRTVGGDWAATALKALRSRRAGRRLTEEIDAALDQLKANGPSRAQSTSQR